MAASKPLVRYVEEIMLKVGKAMSTSEQKKFNSNGLSKEKLQNIRGRRRVVEKFQSLDTEDTDGPVH